MTLFIPVILPLAAIVPLLFTYRKLKLQQWISVVSMAALTAQAILILTRVISEGPFAMQAGGWPAPFGITFVADMFSAILLLTAAVLFLLVTIYSTGFMDDTRKQAGFYILIHGLAAGVNGAFLTGDIFNLYVWFEVMLISSFVLVTLGGDKKQLRGAIKYVVINLIGSVIFLTAIGLMYGQTGTLNMADIALRLRESQHSGLINSSLMLFFVAFGIKAAVFPFYFWLPASYPTPPVAVTAFFAGTLTKVGVYVILRFYSLFVVTDLAAWQIIAMVVAGITMVSGVLMAASAYDIRKILSFHIISQIGYMIMGLGIATVTGMAGAIYFMVHNMLSKTATFLAAGLIYKFRGSYDLKALGWIYRDYPLLAFLFLLPALSLAGIPPMPGFFGKFFLIWGGFQAGAWTITGIALLVSVITLFSMVKIWNEAVWKKHPDDAPPRQKNRLPASSLWATIAMVALIVALGLLTGRLSGTFFEAGRQLLDAGLYIKTVLP
jgi:multicomponent Na+:H+ antiporter subunit D